MPSPGRVSKQLDVRSGRLCPSSRDSRNRPVIKRLAPVPDNSVREVRETRKVRDSLKCPLRWTILGASVPLTQPTPVFCRTATQQPNATNTRRERICRMEVQVRDNDVDQAIRVLKKKLQREGVFREVKLRKHYEKPSQKRARQKAEAIRRAVKLARKRAMLEGRR